MVLLLVTALLAFGQQTSEPYPSPEEFGKKVRRALQLDFESQQNFTFLERRRDVKISMLGKVTIGPLRTFEVYPSAQPGRTYKRLIEVDGVPLSAAELARRDAEHERDLKRAAERRRTAEDADEAEEERRHRDAVLDDVLIVYAATFVGRETIDGRQVLVANLKPRPDARPTTREGRWMKQCEGRIWVSEADYQVVRLDMHAFDDVTLGWGIVGRIHEGSRLRFMRRLFEQTWLPVEVTYEASGRTLLFRPFRFSVTTTYSDYKRR